jgi:protein-tyrosine sulfotransferase
VSLADRIRNRAARVRQHRWRMRAHRSAERHVVMGGSPRSGTTLLRRMFDRHPSLCCGPESSLLLPGRIGVEPLAAGFGLQPSEVRALLEASRSQAAFVDAFARRYCELRGKPRWAEKTPLNVRYFGWVLERFPDARLIHVIRDGRDAVCSMREHPDRRWVDGQWVKVPASRSIEKCARRWVEDTGAGLALSGDPRYAEVRYEDLVLRPGETLERLCDFLAEPFDPAIVPQSASDADHPPRTGPDAAGAVVTTSLGRWKRDLTAPEQATVERIAGARLAELGYTGS